MVFNNKTGGVVQECRMHDAGGLVPGSRFQVRIPQAPASQPRSESRQRVAGRPVEMRASGSQPSPVGLSYASQVRVSR